MKKRIWTLNCCSNYFSDDLPTYQIGFSQSELDFIIEHEWELMIDMHVSGLQDAGSCAAYVAMANALVDMGIPVTVGLDYMFGRGYGVPTHDSYLAVQPYTPRDIPSVEVALQDMFTGNPPGTPEATPSVFKTRTGLYPSLWWSTPSSEYNDRFSDCLDLLNASSVRGYAWTHGYDNGVAWLRENTGKEMNQYLNYGYDGTEGDSNYLYVYNDAEWRSNFVDRYVMEVYSQSVLDNTAEFLQWLGLNHRTTEVGITTTDSPDLDGSGGYWGSTDVNIRRELIRDSLQWLDKQHPLGLSLIETEGAYHWRDDPATSYTGIGITYSPYRRIRFMESFSLHQGTGGAKVYRMSTIPVQTDVKVGTSYMPFHVEYPLCMWWAGNTNSFRNTGREFIMIRNTDGAYQTFNFHITQLKYGRRDYSITVKPKRFAYVGPFPVETYGPLPEVLIEENPAMEVGIVKIP